MSVTVDIRVQINVDASLLVPAFADELAEKVSAEVKKVLATATHELAADGHAAPLSFEEPTIAWVGPGLGAVSAAARTLVASRLTRKVLQGARATTAAAPRPGRVTSAPPGVHVERSIRFHTTPQQFFNVLNIVEPGPSDRSARYHDLLYRPCNGVAFYLRTGGMMFLDELRPLLVKEIGRLLPRDVDFEFALVWSPYGLRKVIDLDPHQLKPLEGVLLSRPSVINRMLLVHEGSRLVMACALLPRVELGTTVLTPAPEHHTIKLRELDPIITAADFLRATRATWDSYRNEWGNDDVAVEVQPFSPRRKVHARTLRAVFNDRERAEANERLQLGGPILLTRHAVEGLPALKLRQWTDERTLALPDTSVNEEWQPTWAGAYVSAWLAFDEFKLGAARYRPHGRVVAGKVIAAFRDEKRPSRRLFAIFGSEFGRSERDIAESSEAFGFFLEQLEAITPKGYWLKQLYDVAEDYYRLFELVVRLAAGTPYEFHELLMRARQRITARRAAARDHEYLPGRGVRVDGDWLLEKGGVIAMGNRMYSSLKTEQRLNEAAKAKLPNWMLAAAQKVIKSAVEEKRELSEEEFSRQVLEELQKQITPDDVETVEVERSLRLIDVIEKDDRGVLRHFVKFNWVQRYEDEPEDHWNDVKDSHDNLVVEEYEDTRFEELMFMWSYARSSVVVIAFAKGVVYLGVAVVAWEGGLFELVPHSLSFVAVNVLIYLGQVAFFGRKFSIDDLAIAALKGYAMALGFRLFQPIGIFLGTGAARLIGTGAGALTRLGPLQFARVIAGYLVERAVAGGFTGAATAVFAEFATDLVLVAVGAKPSFKSWREYLDAMEEGAKWGIIFEFAGPVARVLGKVESVQAAAAAIRRAGWSPKQWWKLLDDVEGNLGRWLYDVARDVKELRLAELVKAFRDNLRSFRGLVFDEIRQGIMRRIITLSDVELTALGDVGLRRFLEVVDPKQAESLLLTLARDATRGRRFLEALGALDENVVTYLANRGQLPALAGSPRITELFASRNPLAMGVLNAFGDGVAVAERFLAELDRLSPAARQRGMLIMGGQGPRPSSALLLKALGRPRLVHADLGALLLRLEAGPLPAGVVLDELLATFEGIGWARIPNLSPSLFELLARRTNVGLTLLRRLGSDVARCEAFLAELDVLPAAAREQGLSIMTGIGPRPTPEALLRALRRPDLRRPRLGELLDRLSGGGPLAGPALDDLFATLERIGWNRLQTMTPAALRTLRSQIEAANTYARRVVADPIARQAAMDVISRAAANPRLSGLDAWLRDATSGAPGVDAAQQLRNFLDKVEELKVANAMERTAPQGRRLRLIGETHATRTFDFEETGGGFGPRNIEVYSPEGRPDVADLGTAINHAADKITAATRGSVEGAVRLRWPPADLVTPGGTLITARDGTRTFFTARGDLNPRGNFFEEFTTILNRERPTALPPAGATHVDALRVYDQSGTLLYRYTKNLDDRWAGARP